MNAQQMLFQYEILQPELQKQVLDFNQATTKIKFGFTMILMHRYWRRFGWVN